MAKPKKTRKTKTAPEMTPDQRARLDYYQQLMSLHGDAAYLEWCEAHDFPARLKKTEVQLKRELERFEQLRTSRALRIGKRRRKDPAGLLADVLSGAADGAPPEMLAIAEESKSFGSKVAGQRYRELMMHVAARAPGLLTVERVVPTYQIDRHNCYIGALSLLARNYRGYLRDPQDWEPSSRRPREQFSSLARHLFAKYEVPLFMDSAWFTQTRTQIWFLHLGRGGNLRTAGRLPVRVTKKLAHNFMQAPSDYTVEQAFRWGQVHAFGGNPRVSQGLRGTALGREFRHEGFWNTVIRFLVANPMLDPVHYGPIIDYIKFQKFDGQEVFIRPGVVRLEPPPRPGFSMTGRNAATLLRQVDEWHRELGLHTRQPNIKWHSCGLRGLSWTEGKPTDDERRQWTVTELLSTDALIAEGRAMNHCVATYAGSCAAGRSSIWSMELDEGRGPKRVQTLELCPSTNSLVEARGRNNRWPTEKEAKIIRRWTQLNDTIVPGYVLG
ncbi:MAG: PcfJ domain-containing protein [Planctomycetota bacterium]